MTGALPTCRRDFMSHTNYTCLRRSRLISPWDFQNQNMCQLINGCRAPCEIWR